MATSRYALASFESESLKKPMAATLFPDTRAFAASWFEDEQMMIMLIIVMKIMMIMMKIMMLTMLTNLSFKLWNAGGLLADPTHDCVRGPPSTVILAENKYLGFNHKKIIISK